MKKRVLSAFMALALCLTLLPVPVWAEEADTHTQTGTDDAVYTVNADTTVQSVENNVAVQTNTANVAEVTAADDTVIGTYDSLNNAITAAQGSEGSTVTLLQNVATSDKIIVDSGTFTLDLNGKKWEKSSGRALWVQEKGNVTVTSTQSTGTINSTGGSAIYVAAGATVHIKKGVQLNSIFAEENANLTLDVGVIITETLSTNADNIATFLTDQALQACDKQGNKTENTYVSIYQNYKNNNESTGCVIVIEHTRCDGTADSPCEICGYDGTQTKPTEPEDPDVAEINGKKYKTLQEAIAAANGAKITLLGVFGENVVVDDDKIKASIILGTGGKDQYDHTYPSYWIAESKGIPLTMNAGEITLKRGVLAQFGTGANNNIAIALKGGTLTVESTVTKIIGGSVDSTAQNTAQNAAIEATGGTLDLQGNTHLDGGLSISGNAQLAYKLKAGTFTNSGSKTASVSVEGDTTSYFPVSDSTEYDTVFDLLAEGYVFAKYNADGTTGDVIKKDESTKSLTEDVTVIKCEHKDASGTSLFEDGTCAGCGFVCEHKNPASDESTLDEDGVCTVCGKQVLVAKIGDKTYESLFRAFGDIGGDTSTTVTVDLLTDVTESVEFNKSSNTEVTLNMNGHSLTSANDGPALTVTGGTLKFEGPVKINGGLLVTDGALEGGLPLDSVFTKGSNSYSIYWNKGGADVFNLRAAKDHAFAAYDSSTGTTGDIIEISTSGFLDAYARQIQMDVKIVPCDHSIGFNSTYAGVFCQGCMSPCPHKSVDDQNKCTECKADMVAKGSGGYYYSLADDAFLNAADGNMVTLLADVELSRDLFMNADNSPADKSVTLVMNGKKIYNDGGYLAALSVSSGKLTISDEAAISIPIKNDPAHPAPAVEVSGGTLEFETKATITSGLKVTDYDSGTGTTTSGKLEGGLKEGTVITANGTGNNCFSVSVEGSSNYKQVQELLNNGYAFAKYNSDGTTGDVVDGYVETLTENVIVVAHTHDMKLDSESGKYICACGFTCTAHHFENGKCTVCGYECTHPSAAEAADGTYTCSDCKQQMVVKVEKDGAATYYAMNSGNAAGDTLRDVFSKAESGSTVTLLADNLLAWAYVSNGKQITLDLNGKTLDETSQGITVGRDDYKDTTSTNNKLIVKGTLGAGEVAEDNNYAFRTWVGGELDLEDFEGGGKIGGIIADGGKVTTGSSNTDITIGTLDVNNGGTELSFSTGTFDKITGNNNKKLGDLLRQNSGCAFQYVDGKFVRYDTVINSSNAVENVRIVTCTHDSITNGTCDYCNLDNLAAALIAADGTVTNYRFTDESDAGAQILLALQAMQTSDNGKVKLFADCEYADKITWEDNKQGTIDLNGHSAAYTGTMNRDEGFLMLNSGTLTITDSSKDKTGSFAYVKVRSDASLIVDGAYVKRIFANENKSNVLLKAGSKFESINLGNSRLFNCLDEGCCISGKNRITATNYAGTTPLTVMQIPGTVTPPTDKNVSISYGSSVPDSFLPTVTLGDGVEASLTYKWLYRDSISYSNPSDAPVTADDQSLDMICVITANKWSGGNTWETAVTGYTLTVGAANLADATVTPTNLDALVFTPDSNGVGKQQTLEFTVTYPDQYTTLTPGTDYEIVDSSNTAADAGEHTLTLQGKGNYAGTLEYKWTVKQRELTGMTGLSKSYDGTTDLPDTIAFTYGENEKVTLTKGTDYTVTGGYDSADAGERTVTATVTLINPNYTFADGKTEQTFTVNTQITKAAVSGLKNVSQTIRCVAGVEQSFMPELTSFGIPADAQIQDISGIRYSNGAPVGSHGSRAPGKIYFTLNDAAKVGDTFSISFNIELTNYKDAYVTINVKLIDRDTPTVAANAITVTYDGSAVSAENITGSATFDGKTVEGTWSWEDGQALTNVSDSGEKTVVFTPTDSVNYKPVDTTVQLTINKATPTGAPKYTAISTSGKTLADAGLTVEDGTFSVPGSVAWELEDTTQVTANTAYKWVFTPKDKANYNTLEGTVTLWRRSSSGGGSSATTKTETTTNPDGSVTKTETKSDGTVIETTTYKDGSTVKTETKKDGSSITETKLSNGSTSTVKTDKNGQTTAEAKVSDKAVSDAKKSDEAVKIPAEVKAGEDSSSAPTVKIDLPKNSGETKIEIPVKDVTSGTVAVIVKPDGTEEIVKDSIPTKDGIQLTVSGDVTVKIVNNAKDFTDTKGHWAEASIDFVSARGLVNGTSSTTFSPNAPTTRAQLWTILARQAGADLTGGANWYEKAQNWAKANGISDGTNPNGIITRAQMVTMLWRAAGSPEVSVANTFTDVPADSYYAKAVAWAVQHGITAGVGSGKFDPNGTCTRAQIATFLHRSYLSK